MSENMILRKKLYKQLSFFLSLYAKAKTDIWKNQFSVLWILLGTAAGGVNMQICVNMKQGQTVHRNELVDKLAKLY